MNRKLLFEDELEGPAMKGRALERVWYAQRDPSVPEKKFTQLLVVYFRQIKTQAKASHSDEAAPVA